jgi:TolB protein
MKKLLAAAACLAMLACTRGAGAPPEPGPAELAPDAEPPVTRLTPGRGGEERDPDVSPDGKTLLYASNEHGEAFDLFLRVRGANTSVRVTRLEGDERFPKFNPRDPRAIAFASNTRGAWEICLLPDVEKDPERVVVISEPGAQSLHPSWSPDGRHLVYCASTESDDAGWVLKVWEAESGKTRVLEGADGFLPEWSPKGNTIVFQRMRRRGAWESTLWTLEYENGAVRDVTALFAGEGWGSINPAWSPDGRHIVFATVGKSRARTDVVHEPDDLWIVRADGSRATRLTTSAASDGMPCWGADGRIYFVSDRERGPFRLWSVEPRFPE